MSEPTLEFWKNMALGLKDELVERGNKIAELEAQLASVSRELVSTDNADRYYRGFNAGFDQSDAPSGAGVPSAVLEAIRYCWRWALLHAETLTDEERYRFVNGEIDKVVLWLEEPGSIVDGWEPRPALDAMPQPSLEPELLAMVSELLNVTGHATGKWRVEDFELIKRINKRFLELTLTLRPRPATGEREVSGE